MAENAPSGNSLIRSVEANFLTGSSGDTAKRLRLDKSELEALVECLLTTEEFLELWHARSP